MNWQSKIVIADFSTPFEAPVSAHSVKTASLDYQCAEFEWIALIPHWIYHFLLFSLTLYGLENKGSIVQYTIDCVQIDSKLSTLLPKGDIFIHSYRKFWDDDKAQSLFNWADK